MTQPHILTYSHTTPCGRLTLGSYDGNLCLCDWESSRHPGRALATVKRALHTDCREGLPDIIRDTITQLDEYFARKRTRFDIPLHFIGTPFQMSVWKALTDIPYGRTISYSTLAEMIGRPSAVRAVANANGANPISIIAPCHRVIGSDGTLTGYGGGLEVKRFLISLEQPDTLII